MIGSIVIGIWVLLGLLNIAIWRGEIDEQTETVSGMINPDFFKRFFYAIMMVVSPYYFVKGINMKVRLYLITWSVKKIMKRVWKKSGKNPREEWKKLQNSTKEKEDEKEN